MSASPDPNPIESAPSPGAPAHDEETLPPADEGAQEQEASGETNHQEAPATEDQPGEGGATEGETYVPATETTEARIPSFKKRSSAGAGEGEDSDDDDDDDTRRRKKKKSRKDRRREEEEEEEAEPEMDEATRRRLALEERIDAIGKKQRAPRRKKRGGEDVDIVDSYHDEICSRLRDRMEKAAERDLIANQNKLPATSKLAMLDEVVSVLQNTTLWSSIIDNEVLKAVKKWLEPLPDRSLPAVGIQKAVFEVLPKMELDTPTIREAGLGPIILFYTKTKRVSPQISRAADALVQTWARPIIKRPADYRQKKIVSASQLEDEEEGGDEDGERSRNRSRSGSQQPPKTKRFNVRQALVENEHRKGARMPIVQDVQYTVAPESRLQHHQEDLQHVARLQMDNKKFNRFARQFKTGGRK